VDLWILAPHTDSNGNMAFMNRMCDISQFVVAVHVLDESSVTLASHFIQHLLMKFGLYHLVVQNDSTSFKIAFIAMCQAFNLIYNILAKYNHKRLSVELFHHFLNKNMTIAVKEHDTNNVFVPVGIIAGYAWNNVPINSTDILRNISAIGRKLHLPLDINLNTVPMLT